MRTNHVPKKRTGERNKTKNKFSGFFLLFVIGSPLLCSMVQLYSESLLQNLSLGKEKLDWGKKRNAILTSCHGNMPLFVQTPLMTSLTAKEEMQRGKCCGRVRRDYKSVVLTSSISRSSWSPFSQRLRCTQFSTLE